MILWCVSVEINPIETIEWPSGERKRLRENPHVYTDSWRPGDHVSKESRCIMNTFSGWRIHYRQRQFRNLCILYERDKFHAKILWIKGCKDMWKLDAEKPIQRSWVAPNIWKRVRLWEAMWGIPFINVLEIANFGWATDWIRRNCEARRKRARPSRLPSRFHGICTAWMISYRSAEVINMRPIIPTQNRHFVSFAPSEWL
jgi:hypothetical protein